jgi:hypothetical protein
LAALTKDKQANEELGKLTKVQSLDLEVQELGF